MFVDFLNFLGYNKLMFRRNKQKESNIATTPEESKRKPRLKRISAFFFLMTILSIALYSCYTFFVIYKLTKKTFLSKFIVYLLGLYVFVFILLILINLGNKRRMKSNLKDYKSATKFLKYSVQIINLILSIFTIISAFITSGTTDIPALAYAFLSLFITLIFIVIEVISIKIRKNLPLIKRNFLELRDKPAKNKR